ncbi:mycothiol transferase [Rhodococcus tibetensis]|uniref:DinB family protein n=1 Tax=Rhodococcus tibetensis TaxID=2965064 RepID=A0ABT1QI13_9NOCA|nr:DUF664 domain-containing protein [Rhodococcus sp. FXJ9.536]MCQ4121837.1 DinB family protein [Rhodococcus sp. FXJ9.536]
MDHSALLTDAFDRIQETVHEALSELPSGALTYRVDEDANTIAWLVWHLTRVQDDHVAGVAGTEQVWTSGGWCERFDLPFPVAAIGYGQSSAEVARVTTAAGLLLGYHDAVHDRTVDYVQSIGPDDLDRIVDENWDPPVTLGVRLISVISDDLQHAGQAAYIRGIYERR